MSSGNGIGREIIRESLGGSGVGPSGFVMSWPPADLDGKCLLTIPRIYGTPAEIQSKLLMISTRIGQIVADRSTKRTGK